MGRQRRVRQFGFDISGHDVAYSVGDTLGVYVTNAPSVVDLQNMVRDGLLNHLDRPSRETRLSGCTCSTG
jgi:sulfite reductase alpha subunit-like flavoprotein